MKSGIWVEAEKAQEAAEKVLLNSRRAWWRDYLQFCRNCRHRPTFILRRKPSWKLYLKRRDKIDETWTQWTRKEDTQYWRTGTQQAKKCLAVIQACKVPPADGLIFLTLDDVETIGL